MLGCSTRVRSPEPPRSRVYPRGTDSAPEPPTNQPGTRRRCCQARGVEWEGARRSERTIANPLLNSTIPHRLAVWKLLAGILQLGNLTYIPISPTKFGDGQRVSVDGSGAELAEVAGLFGIEREQLTAVLTTRRVEARGETIVVALGMAEAAAARDAICKSVYAKLFSWLISRVNSVCVGARCVCPR